MVCKIDDAPAFLVTVAGSAGAFRPLRHLLASLPRCTTTAFAAALHVGPDSVLVDLLRRVSAQPVEWAAPGGVLRGGHVHVAPPRTHLIVNPDTTLGLSRAARGVRFSPSADWLFESAAASFGERHLAIVLSGAMWDGAARLAAVKRHGGTVWVQDPDGSAFPDMPGAAIATGHVDAILPIVQMATRLVRLLAARDAARDARLWLAPFQDAAACPTAQHVVPAAVPPETLPSLPGSPPTFTGHTRHGGASGGPPWAP